MAILVIPNVLSYPLVLFCTLDILKVKTIELKSKDIADLIKVVKASRRMRNSHLQMYLKCKRKKNMALYVKMLSEREFIVLK